MLLNISGGLCHHDEHNRGDAVNILTFQSLPEEYVDASLHKGAAENNHGSNVVLLVKLKAVNGNHEKGEAVGDSKELTHRSPFVVSKNKGRANDKEDPSECDYHIDNVKRLHWLLKMMGSVGTRLKHQNMDMCLRKRDLGPGPLIKKTKDLPTRLEEYSGHDDRPDGGGGGDHIGVRCFKEIGQKMDLIQYFHADDENDQRCERDADTG